VEYKQYIVKAFEQAPDKWRASVKRSDGKPLMVVGRFKLAQFVTGLDSLTAKDALLMAVAAIDAGAFFSRRATLGAASSSRHEIETVNTSAPQIQRGSPNAGCASASPSASSRCPQRGSAASIAKRTGYLTRSNAR
jgi:hypothetical protein